MLHCMMCSVVLPREEQCLACYGVVWRTGVGCNVRGYRDWSVGGPTERSETDSSKNVACSSAVAEHIHQCIQVCTPHEECDPNIAQRS